MAVELTLLSPEKTILTYRLAGIGSRLLAAFIDSILVITVASIIFAGIGAIAVGLATYGIDLLPIINGSSQIFFSLSPFAYFILFEGLWKGQTPGKKLAQIRVRMADGTPVTFGASVSRNLLRVADFFPALFFGGLVSILLSAKLQRIGDHVAGTIVTVEDRVVQSFSVAPHRVGIHPLESAVGELRNMTDAQYYLLRRYCDRFPELPLEVQNDLTESVWLPIAKNLGIAMRPDIHPLYLAEAAVMKYGRTRGLL